MTNRHRQFSRHVNWFQVCIIVRLSASLSGHKLSPRCWCGLSTWEAFIERFKYERHSLDGHISIVSCQIPAVVSQRLRSNASETLFYVHRTLCIVFFLVQSMIIFRLLTEFAEKSTTVEPLFKSNFWYIIVWKMVDWVWRKNKLQLGPSSNQTLTCMI